MQIKKYQSSASLAFVQVIHLWLVNSPHKGPVTWKMFPFDDIIMTKPQGPCTVPYCSDIWHASRHFCCLTVCYYQNTIDIWLLRVTSQSFRTRCTIEQFELANKLSQRDQQQWFQHQDMGNSDWFQTLSTRFIYYYDLNISKCINALLGPISI